MSSSTSSSNGPSARRRAALRVAVRAIGALAVIGLGVNVLKRTNPALERWNVGQAETLFVGTSHTDSGIEPAAFDRPIGVVSFPALDHRLAEAVITRHEDRWPRLKYAVIEIDEFTLFTDATQTNGEDPLELLTKLDLSIGDLPPAADRGSLWRALTLLSGNGTTALHPSLRFTARRLFYDAPPSERRPLQRSAGWLRVGFLSRISVGRPADNIDALVRLSRRLATRGIRVALMTYPQHEYYRAARPPAWDATIAEAVQAVRKSVPDVEYWDFRSQSGFSDEDFFNVDHLSDAGAFKLSSLVARRLDGF
jgi:hypothetical protein